MSDPAERLESICFTRAAAARGRERSSKRGDCWRAKDERRTCGCDGGVCIGIFVWCSVFDTQLEHWHTQSKHSEERGE